MSSSTPIVNTPVGSIKGRRFLVKPPLCQPIHLCSFVKIPYGKVEKRFQLPIPHPGWLDSELDCSRKTDNTKCLQPNPLLPTWSCLQFGDAEDCLYLNVFTPDITDEENKLTNLPVFIFIHGGGFVIESYDNHKLGPDFLLKNGNVILVTINYRLGPFGFLCLEIPDCPGNQGMHDQILSFKWVQKNIKSFGGDPDNVTIIGESAGGMSCLYHLASPRSKGLFKKVISLSGPISGNPFLKSTYSPLRYGKILAKNLGIDENCTPEDILDELISKDPKEIIKSGLNFCNIGLKSISAWKPVVDGAFASPDRAFLPEEWKLLIKKGNPIDSVVCSITSNEGGIFGPYFTKKINDWNALLANKNNLGLSGVLGIDPDFEYGSGKDVLKEIYSLYFNGESMNSENAKSLVDMLSNSYFVAPFFKDLETLAGIGYKVYGYVFNYNGTVSMSDYIHLPIWKTIIRLLVGKLGFNVFRNRSYGAAHADDLLYLFPYNPLTPDPRSSQSDKMVCKQITDVMLSIAHTGKPAYDDSEWKPFKNKEEHNISFVGPVPSDITDIINLDIIEFWNKRTESL